MGAKAAPRVTASPFAESLQFQKEIIGRQGKVSFCQSKHLVSEQFFRKMGKST
jgi:hypothetical protein